MITTDKAAGENVVARREATERVIEVGRGRRRWGEGGGGWEREEEEEEEERLYLQ